jgi:hypothetical protein
LFAGCGSVRVELAHIDCGLRRYGFTAIETFPRRLG